MVRLSTVVRMVTTVARTCGPAAAVFFGGGGAGLHEMQTIRRSRRRLRLARHIIWANTRREALGNQRRRPCRLFFGVEPALPPVRVDSERHRQREDVLHRL